VISYGKRHPVVLSWDLPLRTYPGFNFNYMFANSHAYDQLMYNLIDNNSVFCYGQIFVYNNDKLKLKSHTLL